MANHDLQFFSPLAISQMAVSFSSFDLQLFTLPHYLSAGHKERLVALLLGALRSQTVESASEPVNSMVRVLWEQRSWLNASQSPSIQLAAGDVLWLIVNVPVAENELLAFIESCHCLVLIDLRMPHSIERRGWMAGLKQSLLDAVQQWWKDSVKQYEAKQVDFRGAGEWFDSPIDALDYCNAIAAGLFNNHSLVYVERQAMAEILAGKALALPVESVTALVAFALRELWPQLRFSEQMPLPNFASHFSGWQTAGLGWHVGAEFVPLNAVERLQEREVLDPFFAYWEREREANAQLFNLWDKLRMAMSPPEPAASPMPTLDTTMRPPESITSGGTSGTPESIRKRIAEFFPSLSPEADDSTVQAALIKESDENRRLLLLAWRVSLWLGKAGDRNATSAERLRAENDVTRAIYDAWNLLNLKAKPSQQEFAVAENWARLRVVLADYLTERARVGNTKKLLAKAETHFSKSQMIFNALGIKLQEANVLEALGDLKLRVADIEGARANYEAALLIYRQIEARVGEANVLSGLGDLNFRVNNYVEAQANYEAALLIYRQEGDRFNEANVQFSLGNLKFLANDLAGARASYHAVLPIYRQMGSPLNEAGVLVALGDLKLRITDLDRALAYYEAALLIYRRIEDRLGEANTLQALGDIQFRFVDQSGARASYKEALFIQRQLGNRLGEANLLSALGDLNVSVDDLSGARANYEEALPIYRRIGNRLGEANVLFRLGGLQIRVNDLEGARESYEQAIAIYRRIEARLGEANVLRMVGDLWLAEGDLQKAEVHHKQALTIYREIEEKIGEGEAMAGLGRVALARGDGAEADRLLKEATTILFSIEARYEAAEQIGEFGWLLLRQGKKDAAKSYLLRAADAFDVVAAFDQSRRHRQAAEEI